MKSYGFQSDQVFKAINLINTAVNGHDKIVLAFTGNMISCDLREIICELCRTQKIDAIVTNGAGLEEDLIKTFGNYQRTEFNVSNKELIKGKLYRIGNLAVSHDLYECFEDFLKLRYSDAISDKSCDQTPGSIAKILASFRMDQDSFLFWAHKNNIPVYCPTFHDGAFGDFFVEYRQNFPNYRVDFLLENVKLTKQLNEYEKCGVIVLGGGTSKHFALNNSISRNGYDWNITISTAIPYDGSDSGGDASEARSWGKLRPEGQTVHVFAEATLAFPSIASKGFGISIQSS